MIAYQHYSFDLWMTLIKSNPAFKQARAKFFYDNLNHQGKTLEEVCAVFRTVDNMCNAINEKTGGNITSEEMYLMVISGINNYSNAFNNIQLTSLYDEMEQLLLKYQPVVYCENTAAVLQQIKQLHGVTISLLSNTAFIKGSSLRKVLERIGLAAYFDFQIYSDEIGASKPNKIIFDAMLGNIATVRNGNIDINTIVHVGDNKVADIYGASAAGITGILINANNVSITSLLQ